MEPGHEDREYMISDTPFLPRPHTPQWSPVMKTGNTQTPSPAKALSTCLNGARS